MIDAFLILARETDNEFEDQHIIVADLIAKEVSKSDVLFQDKPVTVDIDQQFPLELYTAEKVVSIVLGNLIRNAVLYTNEGTVTIRIKEQSVEIADTGIGMTEDQIKRIFQPYYRAEHTGQNSKARLRRWSYGR